MENLEIKQSLLCVKEVVEFLKESLPEKVSDILYSIDEELLRLALGEKLNAFIPAYHSPLSGYVDLSYGGYRSHEVALTRFSEGDSKEIPYPDDGIRRPKDGWYLRFSFSCGAYTFNPGYPTKSFNAFFEELRSYKPHHSDTMNHSLYFSLEEDVERAQIVYAEYKDIFKKYQDLGRQEVLSREIAEAQAKLDELKKEIK